MQCMDGSVLVQTIFQPAHRGTVETAPCCNSEAMCMASKVTPGYTGSEYSPEATNSSNDGRAV